jgi:hypothetical protein
MKIRLTLLSLVASALALAPARAEDASKVDPTQQATQFAPSPDNANPQGTKSFDTQPDSSVQNHKADLPGLIDEPKSGVGEKRAPIDVGDTFQRKTYDRKESTISTTPMTHQDSTMDGQTAPDKFLTTSTFSQSGTTAKYQEKLSSAFATQQLAGPEANKTTTFAQVNKFVFKRNGPGTDGGPAAVTAAGGGTGSTSTGAPQAISSSGGGQLKVVASGWGTSSPPTPAVTSGNMQLLMVGAPGPVPKTLMVKGKQVPISTSNTPAVPQN